MSCKNCDGPVARKRNTYCSNACQFDYQYKQHIDRWKAGEEKGWTQCGTISKTIRRYLFEKYESECAECGWSKVNPTTGLIPLQVEHIDGNWQNCTEENLTLICPSCHSLTPTYGSLNIGNGRGDRYLKRYNK